MRGKIVGVFVLLFSFVVSVDAQNPKFSGWGKNYTTVNSYDGKLEQAALQVRIEKSGLLDLQPGWKIAVTATTNPISNGKIFPLDKIYFQPYFISGSSNDPGPLPTISQLGFVSPVYAKDNAEAFIIPSSPYHIYNKGTNNSYFDMLIQLNLGVSGGSYLKNLLVPGSYNSPEFLLKLEFNLYDKDNLLLGNYYTNHTIQISYNLSGTPPTENNFSIQISNSAKNGLLELKSMADYISGKNVTYAKGITVSSNVAYQLNMKSQSQYFESVSNDGKQLPLDVLKVQLLPNGNEVALRASPQTLYKGESTNSQSQSFDLKYSTIPNDQRLFEADVEEYKTTLTYEITVQ